MAEDATAFDAPNLLEEIQSGDGLTLAGVGKLFPSHRGPGTVDPATVYRWATAGTKAPDGRLIKLATVRVGSRLLTSRSAVARYVEALTNPPAAAVPPVAEKPRRSRGAAAVKKLQALGA